MEELTKEYLENKVKELFKDSDLRFLPIHYTWEENGEKFSSWTWKTDRGKFTTGDGGMREFTKLFNEEIHKMLEDGRKDT